MALSKSKASQGSKTHEAKPTSKLSKFNAYTKPESRPSGAKNSVGSAQSLINKMFS